MLITFLNRQQLIAALGNIPAPAVAELGVWRGEFSRCLLETLAPRSLTLVDAWSEASYTPAADGGPQMQGFGERIRTYFGGEPAAALEAAYRHVVETFRGDARVSVVRADTWEAATSFPDGSFDVIYLDANHRHEHVLGDMYAWFPKLRKGGLFFCNDFYEGADSRNQNFGVISAYATFAKRFRTHPVALAAVPYSDFVFTDDPSSDLARRLVAAVLASGTPLLEVPDSLVAAYHHRMIGGRAVPSLETGTSASHAPGGFEAETF